MIDNLQTAVFLTPPLLLIAASLVSYFKSNEAISLIKKISSTAMLLSILLSLLGGVLIYNNSSLESTLLGWNELGFSLKIDTLSMLLFGMISIIGFVVLKYSQNYLQGDPNQNKFIGKLSLTLASVLLFVLSGNLFMLFASWVAMSLSLHQLLLFYPNRKKAQAAALKKFIVARIGDVFLLTALVILYHSFGTGNLASIYAQIQNEINLPESSLNVAAIFLVLAAIMKSAQFPFHGWLVEVMETPTPVSATLHAGLINAGPFLIIRMSHVIHQSEAASILLLVVGGISAIFGAISFTTQPAQKTALAYSSIAHMGFSLLTSGMGLYAASALHLVAHSFYKGHAFLSSGTAVQTIKLKKIKIEKRTGNIGKIALGVTISLVLYTASAFVWNISLNNIPFLALSAIAGATITLLLVAVMDSKNFARAIFQTILLALIIYNCFFAFESGMHHLLEIQVAEIGNSKLINTVILSLAAVFISIISIQILSPLIRKTTWINSLGVHFRNGWYINNYTDKWLNKLYLKQTTSKNKKDSLNLKSIDTEFKIQ